MTVADALARLTAGLAEDERIANRTAHLIPGARLDWFDAVEAVYAGDDMLVHTAPAHGEGRITAHIARQCPKASHAKDQQEEIHDCSVCGDPHSHLDEEKYVAMRSADLVYARRRLDAILAAGGTP